MLFFLTIAGFVALTTSQPSWVIEDDGCRTPDRGTGICIQIKECKPIVDLLLNSGKPIPAHVQDKLRQYTCGFIGREVKVCCPKAPIVIPSKDNLISQYPPPPVVSNHRNLYLLPEDCGYIDPTDRIIHGQKTGLFEFPWMALLGYNTRRGIQYKCGGTIVNDRYILTAAHCISNLKSPLVSVRVGEHNLTSEMDCEMVGRKRTCAPPIQELRIEQIIVHQGYNSTVISNDIGLLRVSKMDLSRINCRPVCLPVSQSAREFNWSTQKATITGWGATETGRPSPVLLKVTVPVSDLERCREVYKSSAPITYKQLCAGGIDQKDSCPGDSGGPLHAAVVTEEGDPKFIQMGVVSFGHKFCGSEGFPGVYTKVVYYLDWILDNIRP